MKVLVTRLDNMGDVILAGPAVRAAAAVAEVHMLCGPSGAPAARLLPGVEELVVWDAPWTGFDPPPVNGYSIACLVEVIRSHGYDKAAVLTSFHQSPLPTALLLRIAGVPEVAAVSVDYPGALLDHRLPYQEDLHEVEQNLEVMAALGFHGDDRLQLEHPPTGPMIDGPYVVLHSGASVPARRIPDQLASDVASQLALSGTHVVITGTSEEKSSSWRMAEPLDLVSDMRGDTSMEELVSVIAGADVVVTGNSGPAHVAAATGTPVVSVFAPVVPYGRWRPWRVPTMRLGHETISCMGCRARTCPYITQACVADISARDVVDAIADLRATQAVAP